MSKKIDHLLSREDYVVTQANDLAKAFGKLSAFQHKLLDFCFSYVSKDSKPGTVFKLDTLDVIRHFKLPNNGESYSKVVDMFRSLNVKTPLYLLQIDDDGNQVLVMTHLFSTIRIYRKGSIDFTFSRDVEPYVFSLTKRYMSFHLSELSRVKSKYTLVLLKLWDSNSMQGHLQQAVIKGTLDEWELWFLGKDRHWPAGRFKRDALNVALNELNKLYPTNVFALNTIKDGVKVIGYQLNINPIKKISHEDTK